MPVEVRAANPLEKLASTNQSDNKQVKPFSMNDLLGTDLERPGDGMVEESCLKESESFEKDDSAQESVVAEWLPYMESMTLPVEKTLFRSLDAATHAVASEVNDSIAESLPNTQINRSISQDTLTRQLSAGSGASNTTPQYQADNTQLSIPVSAISVADYSMKHTQDIPEIHAENPLKHAMIQSSLLRENTPVGNQMIHHDNQALNAFIAATENIVTTSRGVPTGSSGIDPAIKPQNLDTDARPVPVLLSVGALDKQTTPILIERPITDENETYQTFDEEPNLSKISDTDSLELTTIENQPDRTLNLDALTQQLNAVLTQDVTPILSKGMQALPPSFLTQAGNAPSIRMELASLQPEPLVEASGLQLENFTAQIKVHPEELGPITAKIEIKEGVATLTFLTEHPHVKQLMEANLPELRQAFQQSHLNLNTVDVQSGGSQDKKEPHQPFYHPEEDDGLTEKQRHIRAQSEAKKSDRSIIDTYA
jgi:flagellar hook-length control protein FliK